MGLKVALEDEQGQRLETVFDCTNMLHRLLRPYQGGDSLLAQIDWYGNTFFNRLQMPLLLSALRELAQQSKNDEETKLVQAITALAERSKGDVHLYIKFIGD
jgi:hypothetical protein